VSGIGVSERGVMVPVSPRVLSNLDPRQPHR